MTHKMLAQEFKIGEEDAKWVAKNLGRLCRKYDGQYIAVYKKRVIEHDPDARALGDRLRAGHPEMAEVAHVSFVSRERVNLIL
jgi:hypothetical protein